MTEKELRRKYQEEICNACKDIQCGQKKLTLPQKERLSEELRIRNNVSGLQGPVADGDAMAYDAILVSVMENPQTRSIKIATILKKDENGEIVEDSISVVLNFTRNYPGLFIKVVESKGKVGIYEDTVKNEKYPLMQEYIQKVKKAENSKFIHQMMQIFLCLCGVFFSLYVDEQCKEYGSFIRIVACLVVVVLYNFILWLLKQHYVKKYGLMLYKQIFAKYGIAFSVLWILGLFNMFLS